MTNQLCILHILECNSAISSMLNANEFVYQNFYIQPPKSACDSRNSTVLSPFAIRGPSYSSILTAHKHKRMTTRIVCFTLTKLDITTPTGLPARDTNPCFETSAIRIFVCNFNGLLAQERGPRWHSG